MCFTKKMFKCYVCQKDFTIATVVAEVCIVQRGNGSQHITGPVYVEQPKNFPFWLCRDCIGTCLEVQRNLHKDYGYLSRDTL